ncbi:hypothetical protein ACQ4LE_003057 [Meloidogyne hapla]|uniref:BHLH domain-containing protein n=1 Tax=Meloidogyne hapla TaxID=6305 RepID=A0A1I8BI25_MELHA
MSSMEKKIKQQKIKEKQQKEFISSNNNFGNNKSSKLRLRDTLLNMLGEFVALNKSPEVRLSSASQQFLADAVLEEKRHLDKDHIRHVRSVSSNAALASPSMGHSQIPTSNSFIHHSRHVSLPTSQESSNRFSLFPPRLRKVAQADDRIRSQLQQQKQQRQANVISEENEEEIEQQQQQTTFKTKDTRVKKEGRKAVMALPMAL